MIKPLGFSISTEYTLWVNPATLRIAKENMKFNASKIADQLIPIVFVEANHTPHFRTKFTSRPRQRRCPEFMKIG